MGKNLFFLYIYILFYFKRLPNVSTVQLDKMQDLLKIISNRNLLTKESLNFRRKSCFEEKHNMKNSKITIQIPNKLY